jgi:hypothetical protein
MNESSVTIVMVGLNIGRQFYCPVEIPEIETCLGLDITKADIYQQRTEKTL